MSRAPYGARGLKYVKQDVSRETADGRAPYGARGLKLTVFAMTLILLLSRPVWGAWIEICYMVAPPRLPPSRPVWGAWIEIKFHVKQDHQPRGRAPYGARGLKCCFCGVG